MDVLNMNTHQVSVKLKTPSGGVDYATVAKGRRVTLPTGYVVDTNWLATAVKIKAFENSTSKTPIELKQAAILPVPAPAPVSSDTNVKAD